MKNFDRITCAKKITTADKKELTRPIAPLERRWPGQSVGAALQPIDSRPRLIPNFRQPMIGSDPLKRRDRVSCAQPAEASGWILPGDVAACFDRLYMSSKKLRLFRSNASYSGPR